MLLPGVQIRDRFALKGEKVAIRGLPDGHNPTELAWNDDVSWISTWFELRSTWNTSPRDAGKTWEEPDP
jgi:hypothetical protein